MSCTVELTSVVSQAVERFSIQTTNSKSGIIKYRRIHALIPFVHIVALCFPAKVYVPPKYTASQMSILQKDLLVVIWGLQC